MSGGSPKRGGQPVAAADRKLFGWPTLSSNSASRLGRLLLLLALMPLIPISTIVPSALGSKRHYRHEHQQHAGRCTVEGAVCSSNQAHICRNSTCVSACSSKAMKPCQCDTEEDDYCFLCCGSEHHRCLAAHEHGILRDNGERWERESCARCRMNQAEMEGMACDDRDPQRLCLHGKCSRSVCAYKQQGEHCDKREEKVCVDDLCENPCARISSNLMVCDCPEIDLDTGFASEDRCQLCCYDFKEQTARRCRNAYRNYGLKTVQGRPIWRIGLSCAGGKKCNRYGICSNDAGPGGGGGNRMPAIVVGILVFVFIVAALITTSEAF